MGSFVDLTDIRFGKLVAKRRAPNSGKRTMWECECDCGNVVTVCAGDLKNGHTKSCGCLVYEIEPNEYDLSGRYAKMIFEDGTETIFNKKYYNFIKQYHWWVTDNHVFGYVDGRPRALAVVIMEEAEFIRIGRGYVVDHINRNPLDNRRSNLRIATYSENNANHAIRKDNQYGCTGISYCKKSGRWSARINFEGKLIHLGFFCDKEDAIKARKRAEREYFGRFAPH